MKKILLGFLLTLVFMASGWGTALAAAKKGMGSGAAAPALSASAFQLNLKRLCLEQTGYTRHFILSLLAELPDLEKVKGRLLKNQEDIAEEFKTFYGEKAAEKMAEILKKHVGLSEELVRAVSKGTQEQFLEVNAKLEANAEELAEYWSSLNPKLPKQHLSNLLFKQLNALSGQVNARVKKDWDSDFAYYEKSLAGMITLSDTLAEGIVRQFPKRFTK